MTQQRDEMRVVLINPPVLAVLEPWFDRPDFVRTGLAYIAAYLRQFPGFQIEVIDAKFERLSFEQVLHRVVQARPDVVGLTAFTNEIKPAAYQAALVKKAIPTAVTVIGGVHVSALPERTLEEFSSFDLGVVGEGEETFYELCNSLRTMKALKDVKGLVLREGDAVFQSPPRARIQDQDRIPLPAWDLFPPAETYFIQSQRGCPYNCQFCMNPNGRVVRSRSIQSVIEEMEWLIEDFGAKRISFGDELFSVDEDRTHQLLDAMIHARIGKRVTWDIQTHVRYVNDALFEKFKAANIGWIEMAIETGDEEKLRSMGKGTNLPMIQKAFSGAKKWGLKSGAFFLFGQPNETRESILKTIQIAVRVNPSYPMFGIMVPYPGTEVARLASKGEGGYKVLSMNWDDYNKQIGGALEFADLSRRQIELLQIWAYVKVFLANYRFFDLIRFLWKYLPGGISVLRKLILQKDNLADLLKVPHDYEDLIRGKTPATLADLEESSLYWRGVQKKEMVMARKAKLNK